MSRGHSQTNVLDLGAVLFECSPGSSTHRCHDFGVSLKSAAKRENPILLRALSTFSHCSVQHNTAIYNCRKRAPVEISYSDRCW